MPLIASSRYTPADLAHWRQVEREDLVHAQLAPFARRVEQARDAVRTFAADGPCYAGVSWGKDSTVLAHLVATEAPQVPLVYVRVVPIANPDCALVRDAFLERSPRILYDEVQVSCWRDDQGTLRAAGTLERGFEEVRERYGHRYVSGVRGEESGARQLTVRRNGVATADTCRPLAWWSAADVWAYLAEHDLPIHPAYACSQGGAWPRDRIRVSGLGMRRGRGAGRAEWEIRYYGEELRRIGWALADPP